MTAKQRLSDLNKQLKEKTTGAMRKKRKQDRKKLEKVFTEETELILRKNKDNVELKIKGTIVGLAYLLSQAIMKSDELKEAIRLLNGFQEFKEKEEKKVK